MIGESSDADSQRAPVEVLREVRDTYALGVSRARLRPGDRDRGSSIRVALPALGDWRQVSDARLLEYDDGGHSEGHRAMSAHERSN